MPAASESHPALGVRVCDPPAWPEVGEALKNEHVSWLAQELPFVTDTETVRALGREPPTVPVKFRLDGEIDINDEVDDGGGGGGAEGGGAEGTLPESGQVIPSTSGRAVVLLQEATPP